MLVLMLVLGTAFVVAVMLMFSMEATSFDAFVRGLCQCLGARVVIRCEANYAAPHVRGKRFNDYFFRRCLREPTRAGRAVRA